MRNYFIFLKKELFEAIKTFKLLILGLVFLIFGIMSPLFAKMMPEIMRWAMSTDPSTAGIDLSSLFTNPTAIDAWLQFYSNVGQIGLIVLVVVFSGMLSSEISKGTLTIILTKGLTRSTAILAKMTSAVIIWTGCLLIAFFTSWGYTAYFFPTDKLPHIIFAIFCLWVYGLFLLTLTSLMAALTKTTIFCMLATGAGAVVFMLLNVIPFVSKYNPASLVSAPISLLAEAATIRSVMPTLIATFIIIITLALLSVITFDRTRSKKWSIALAALLAVSMLINVFLSESIPAIIKLNQHVITEKVTIGAGTDWELAGKLTLPKNAEGKIPAVVLVQGSGPSDMDEKIFDNKPFKEIAEYLSANGIAVIRYNKRTYTHGIRISDQDDGSFTVWEESMEDAIFATQILKADSRIDESKVFILGHSLGGMLAPRIHAYGGDYAGLILFAGSPRFLLDIMEDQQALALNGIAPEQRDEIEAINKKFNDTIWEGILLSDTEAKKLKIDEMGGMSVYYFKDLYDNPPHDFIKDITVPFLVMHANEDLQVSTEKDYRYYQEIFTEYGKDATFKEYPGLNHLFMPAKVKDITELMSEYKIKANIDGQVLEDIVNWVKAN